MTLGGASSCHACPEGMYHQHPHTVCSFCSCTTVYVRVCNRHCKQCNRAGEVCHVRGWEVGATKLDRVLRLPLRRHLQVWLTQLSAWCVVVCVGAVSTPSTVFLTLLLQATGQRRRHDPPSPIPQSCCAAPSLLTASCSPIRWAAQTTATGESEANPHPNPPWCCRTAC